MFSSKFSREEKLEFELLVKQNMQRAYYSALGFVKSHDMAVELSQEAFIRAYRNFKQYDPNRNFFTWYYKILKNLCLNYIRDSKSKTYIDFIEPKESDSNNPQSELEQKEINSIVQKALSILNESDREIILLKEFQGLSYKEIAELLNIPIGTVMSRIYYARKKMAITLRGKI